LNLMMEPHEDRNPERDPERRIAGQVLLQSIRDYHCAKYIIKKNKVASRHRMRGDLDFLTRTQRDTLFNGKEAWEWITRKPLPGPQIGFTFDKCCEVLELDPIETRANALKASSARALKNAHCTAYHIAHLQRNTRGRRTQARGSVLAVLGGQEAGSGEGCAPDSGGMEGAVSGCSLDHERQNHEQHLD
jgi:hypothetical protein